MNKQVFFLFALIYLTSAVSAQAQVVQLPTYQVFSVGTTVSIPDRGAAYLGGVTRGAWGSSSSGVPGLSQVPGLNRLFTNRGIGSSVSSSHAYATATIIDHAEMDRMLLEEAAARRGEPVAASETDRRAAFLSAFVAKRPTTSVADPAIADSEDAGDFAARLAAAESEYEAEMAACLQRAEAAVAAGRLGAARCCYNVLIRRGSDEQKRFAAERLTALETSRAAEKLATRE
ncbi:MAG: hypothetical protein ABI614_17715 [Planctomycetota bacterium]